jgi:hypothetical protein
MTPSMARPTDDAPDALPPQPSVTSLPITPTPSQQRAPEGDGSPLSDLLWCVEHFEVTPQHVGCPPP